MLCGFAPVPLSLGPLPLDVEASQQPAEPVGASRAEPDKLSQSQSQDEPSRVQKVWATKYDVRHECHLDSCHGAVAREQIAQIGKVLCLHFRAMRQVATQST